jgi:16S rRNA (adenine1518-N6/adenine1519-N6)-dimethyltransferase
MHHVARKRFGQHFLHDKQIIQRLVDVINPCPGQHIVEIGPGQGALTVPVLKQVGQLDVVEIDWDLIPALKTRCLGKGLLITHQADALEFDFRTLQQENEQLRIIGNLPYNISTPLIFHLLTFADYISDMHFMLQKEVVDRMAAQAGSDDYGRLSIMVQYHCAVTSLFYVPPSAFYPPPQVDSSIVRLVPHQKLPFAAKNYEHFANMVRMAFSHRRKTLRNCLKTMMGDEDWGKIDIDPKLRPEQLSVGDYVRLSNLVF